MKRLLLTALAHAAGLLLAAGAPQEPLNIVVLLADDWRHDTLGCAGNPVVRTPALDRLAGEGMRFTRNCVTTSICGVSRASLFTGQWMSRHGNTAMREFKTPWEQTYPGLLRDGGYHVGHVGKWHNGAFPARRFDFGRAYSGTHWIKQADGTRVHVTEKNRQDALEFLRDRPEGKPFCLTVAFFAPHAEDEHPRQYLPQPRSMALYDDVSVPVPRTATPEALAKLPDFLADPRNEGRARWRKRFDTPERFQESMKNYYRLCSEVDEVCGGVIEELRRQGVLDRTLVVFTGDNGYFHGEHGLADKWYPYEESIRVPLIVRDPRMAGERRGGTSDAMTLNVDLAPTILTAAGIAAPDSMQGRDVSTLYLAAHPPAWRDDYFYEHAVFRSKDFIPASEALVQRDWKYLRWPDFGREQLFHLAADPCEERDLIGDPGHADRLAGLRKRFEELKSAAR